FQLTDDILDFKRRDGAEMQDLKNGVINAVIFELMSAHQGGAETINMTERQVFEPTESQLEMAIGKTRARAEHLLQVARDSLQKIFDGVGPSPSESQQRAFKALN